MTYITATYSPEDNKIRLYASARLDKEEYLRVKSAGYIWAPKQDCFVAPMWTPEREDLAIELAGEIGDEDTSLVDRAEQRADRFEGYRDRRAADAERAHNAVKAIADNIPLGQPILVGHHSERHARRDAEKIENGMRKAVRMWETSEYWKYRAAGAIRHAKYKELPAVRARRIKGLEADLRKQQRNKQEAEMWLKLWTECAKEQDKELQMQVARRIAGACWLHLPRKEGDRPDWSHSPTAYDALNNSSPTLYAPRTIDEVFAAAQAAYPRSIAHCERWINHLENRLTYEKAMLAEQGAEKLLEKKPRPKQLPLCNYRAPGGALKIENMYHRGEMITYPQVEMTQAEYTRINIDYKGTRVVDRSHRVRTAMIKHELVCVFLTDSKVHERPAAADPAPDVLREPKPKPTVTTPVVKPTTPVDAKPFEDMRETLRNGGVKVVSAPQLFPTPLDLAEEVIELADIRPGDRVLEPSAGTGRILDAILKRLGDHTALKQIVAVEINCRLADALRAKYPTATVFNGDFLSLELGMFDVIVMNPPFEKGQDIKHIEHAMQLLKPGGRLAAICANGPRQNDKLRPTVKTWRVLPAGTFESSGTGVNTALLTFRAPARFEECPPEPMPAEKSGEVPPIAGAADLEYASRIEADRVTAQFRVAITPQAPQETVESLPLFGGWQDQMEMFN